jgi:hypothetical protein
MRRLLLLLLLYVAADFANPLMPGAVRFVAGEMDVVDADRSGRPLKPQADPARLVAVVPARTAGLDAPALPRPGSRPPLASILLALRTGRRPPPLHLVAPASSPDDH